MKRKHKFQDYKNCLEETQTEKKINQLEKNNVDVYSLKEFIKNNKVILKTQQRFKSERHNVFTEEIKKIALSSNDDRRMQSFDSIKTYTYGTSKDQMCKKKQIKRNNIIRQYKNV